MGVVARIFAVVLGLMGLGLLVGGAYLAALVGSPYYLAVGLVYLASAVLIWLGRRLGLWLVVAVGILTVPWAVWESGTYYWALFPRLWVPFAMASLALLLVPSVLPRAGHGWLRGAGALALAGTIVFFVFAFVPHGMLASASDTAYTQTAQNESPSNWFAYGRTTKGTRYAPFTQINRENVSDLQVAWTYHTGDSGAGGTDQNTPLQIGNLVYTCSYTDHVAALDADTGKPRWTFNPHASSPMWQRCRGLGYFEDADTSTGKLCHQRIVQTTIDARLIELDAETGKKCTGFGDGGTVNLGQGMGEIKPGFYFQTSAPLVAGDKIVIGGWVVDNQSRGEPSGVIRAFDARTGKLAWAWDMGHPNRTGAPPSGKTYTRGTPNMWTTAAYDPKLGLIYLPLGNETPDYYGVDRLAVSGEYNSSLVALDVKTGREVWHFQTVHHDTWDYDLPSQPALVDIPDGSGGTIPAVLQLTKRGQMFLLNRKTGKPIANVKEKPVPTTGGPPKEKHSPTQPYSVGMPTIGGMHLDETKMWGMTMFDQMTCRIAFHKLRYDGDFTPIGLTRAIEQPGNLGGMNWGSASVDVVNGIAYVNDIRIPAVFQLLTRKQYKEYSKTHRGILSGHGPSPMLGTPYGLFTGMWMSSLGVPCVEPPFGTISAVDLKTHKLLWQIPAGTAEELGPAGIPLHLPMPMGMPTYAGTMTTAGGLVFFAGFQDFYIRAYNSSTGEVLWKHRLPVGASATPMTYVSPRTGRQYVVLSVGGAARSDKSGDYVIAFALAKSKTD